MFPILEFIGLTGWLTILAVYRLDWDAVPVRRGRHTPRILVRVRWAWRRMRRNLKSPVADAAPSS